jgi:hypothetical protein
VTVDAAVVAGMVARALGVARRGVFLLPVRLLIGVGSLGSRSM